jgi:hypothetical protein
MVKTKSTPRSGQSNSGLNSKIALSDQFEQKSLMNMRINTPRDVKLNEFKSKKPASGLNKKGMDVNKFSIKQQNRQKSAANPTRSKSSAWKTRRNTTKLLPSADIS